MAESNEQSQPEPTPDAPLKPLARPAKQDQDAAIDEALTRALGKRGDEDKPELPLKRQWDAAMEAELEAALEGFDPKAFEPTSNRKGPGQQAQGAAGRDRGQEAHKGTRSGKVIAVRGKSIFVDMGGKSEGVLSLDQFPGEPPQPGAEIEVVVDHYDPGEGIQHLRMKGAAIDANWENLRKGVIVEAKVTKVIKGGVEVDVDGIRGFMPISQIDLSRVEDAASYVNQKFKALVTEANQREKNLVISRRDLLEQERAEMREKTGASLEEGQTREGVVRSVKDFGAFVDIGGVDGLLPIGEMSWSRVSKTNDLVRIGDNVTVKILKIDQTTRKLTLGLKQLTPSPWDLVETKYHRGTMIKGKITRLMEFGAFVELEPGIEGLIHISELSPNRVRRVADIVKPDQEVEVRILKVESEIKRIALSLMPDPKGVKPEEAEEPGDDTPAPPKPVRKVPLKGGLGERDRQN